MQRKRVFYKIKGLIDFIFEECFHIAGWFGFSIVMLYFQGNPAWETVFLSAIILSIPWNIHRGMFGDKLKAKYDKFFDYPEARSFAKEDLFALIDCENEHTNSSTK